MHTKNIITGGKKISEASKVLILLHGRGGNAQNILSLANDLKTTDFALFAPQATNNTWYPYSFLAPPSQNEPWLSSGLDIVYKLLEEVKAEGIASEDIYFGGFSQGACLTAEFVTRNAEKFGGVVLFTGGLIGDKIYSENYNGNFNGTPVFIGSGNPDAHVPVERVKETQKIMESMNAKVNVAIYDNRPHTISQDEIEKANQLVFTK
ncbi:dienelactone hydrolase family protein [Gramella sp. GC03-9]|uniref:Dienelactone hydrolase family protein n=1 Tax=Christiangramia oceanisediminis TaxID=2920386 RepID=A0A9X2KYZ6_9FLAO|nr:dienelactone hydrolase family protein [Gramella oceanisediminis]MCP9200819.1 dienelactone hydrolase family protein [Gramella oceanisediminis]